jgi:formylglycine-generating enzyme required for sulfatase activity
MMGNSLTVAAENSEFRTYGIDDIGSKWLKMEYPCHRVRITRPFYMGACHVTRGQFRRFVEDTGYKTDAERGDPPGANGVDLKEGTFFGFQKDRSWHNVAFPQADDHPVVNVSWNDADAFCKWLSRKEKKRYRLPTEAEWEYACRAGTSTRYWCGDEPETLAEAGNTADAGLKTRFPGGKGPSIRANDGHLFTSPVGSFRKNPNGLYDMHGNAWQWCADWFSPRYYEDSPTHDPKGPNSGNARVLRGGAWNFGPIDCRSAARFWLSPASRNDHTGFRVVLESDKTQKEQSKDNGDSDQKKKAKVSEAGSQSGS